MLLVKNDKVGVMYKVKLTEISSTGGDHEKEETLEIYIDAESTQDARDKVLYIFDVMDQVRNLDGSIKDRTIDDIEYLGPTFHEDNGITDGEVERAQVVLHR